MPETGQKPHRQLAFDVGLVPILLQKFLAGFFGQ
jgi:hypothetical protein